MTVAGAGAATLGLPGAMKAAGQGSFAAPIISEPTFPDREFSITKFGATHGGRKMNTVPIADAVAACSGAGGGVVIVPPGRWLSGAIHLKSNVNLHLMEGAEIVFSTDPEDYLPVVFTRWEGVECYNYSSLVHARGCENVAITGKGTLNGRGDSWWPWSARSTPAVRRLYRFEINKVGPKDRIFGTVKDALRPPLVQLVDCRNVLLADYTGLDSPFWTNHLVYCENVTARDLKTISPPDSPNTDGVNLDSTRNAVVKGLYSSTGDDAVCVKSGRDEDAWRVGRPTENVLIEDCLVEKTHGGFVVGSEMSGGIRNILVRNCVYNGAQRGVRLKSRRGRGGYVRDIWVEDIRMGKITGGAININLFYATSLSVQSGEPPVFENINIKNVQCERAAKAVDIRGLPESPVKGLTLENLSIRAGRGLSISDAERVLIKNVGIRAQSGPVMKLADCRDVTVTGSSAPPNTGTFLKAIGRKTAGVKLKDNDLSRAARKTSTGIGVPAGAVETD
jgi:polygalacturonase